MDCWLARKVDEIPHDIALVILSEPIQGLTYGRLGIEPQLQEAIELVGYGAQGPDKPDTLGSKSKGSTTLDAVYSHALTYNGTENLRANLMGGDSGGPSFVKRGGKSYVVGVHSNVASFCDKNQRTVGVDIRVEPYLEWIRQESPDQIP